MALVQVRRVCGNKRNLQFEDQTNLPGALVHIVQLDQTRVGKRLHDLYLVEDVLLLLILDNGHKLGGQIPARRLFPTSLDLAEFPSEKHTIRYQV